jgi:sugar phosphate isomerase/epimerase
MNMNPYTNMPSGLNKHRFSPISVLWTFCICVGLTALNISGAPVYHQNFQNDADGSVPEDFLVLGGDYSIQSGALVLPGTPLNKFGAVFGPDNEGDLEISARIRSEKRGRLSPSFGIGLYGLGGYALNASNSKNALELFRGRKAVSQVSFNWTPSTWTHMKLAVSSTSDSTWSIRGKAWSEQSHEPDHWQIEHQSKQAPTQGKASIWGQPYSDRPIEFDDITIDRPKTFTALPSLPFELGLQTWTLRNLDFDQAVAFAKEHGITKLQVIGNHIDPHADWEIIKAKKAVLDANGLQAYTFGVAGTSTDHAYNRRLFEFAKYMGIKLIVVEPRDFAIFDSLEALVKEFDIKIAIHNHGLTSLYGNPLVVRNIIQHRDARIGVCLDVGWITASGFDAAKVFQEYEGRVYDIHLKDKTVQIADNRLVGISAGIGEGDANISGLIEVLKTTGFKGVLAIETDSPLFARQPSEFVTKAKAYYESLLTK